MEIVFDEILKAGIWGRPYYSGAGSTFESTVEYRKYLKKLLRLNNIQTVVDLGCGNWDFYHEEFDEVDYVGYDCVKKVIDINTENFGNTSRRQFVYEDISNPNFSLDEKVDLIIIKDVLQHLSNDTVEAILTMARKHARFILTTNDYHPEIKNEDTHNGGHRRMNIFDRPLVKFNPLPIFPYSYKMMMLITGDGVKHTEFKLSDKKADKTIFIAILAKNKAYCLERYLSCITDLDYDKKLITIYINTNNNTDNTEQILKDWMNEHSGEYHDILFESRDYPELTNEKTNVKWTPTRTGILGQIRTQSLKMAKELGCDYYFVSDCDNFVTNPFTLTDLVLQNKPIISPMLRSIPNNSAYSNYWYGITPRWYYQNHPRYYEILNWRQKSNHLVPVVHCTYLVDCKYADELTYIEADSGDLNYYEFSIFCRSAYKSGINQYIRNNLFYGLIFLEVPEKEAQEFLKYPF